jgi:hypothetical protein
VDPWLVGPVAALLILTAAPAFVPDPGGFPYLGRHESVSLAPATGRMADLPVFADTTPSPPARAAVGAGEPELRTGSGPNLSPPEPPAPSVTFDTGSLVASLDSVPASVDVGVTVTLTGSASGGTGPYQPYWSLETGNVSAGWSIRWTAPDVERTVPVLFGVRDGAGTLASTTAMIHVVADPFLELSGAGDLGDVGVPFFFQANLSAGDGPFTVDWTVPGGASNGSAVVPSDGTYDLAVVPNAPGPVWVLGSVVDAWNRSFNGLAPVGRATPPPSLTPASVPFAEVGYPTPVAIEVADGTPPFAWSVAPVVGVTAEAPADGSIGSDGAIALTVTFDRTGTIVLPVSVVDGSGVTVSANVTVTVASGLNLSVVLGTSDPVAGATVPVHATISGGLPPYGYRLSLSDAETCVGNESDPGTVTWTAAPVSGGYLTLRGSVTDATGRTANVTFTVYVAPAGSAPTPVPLAGGPSATSGWLLGGTLAGAVLALVGGFAVRRWVHWPRRSPGGAASPGAGRSVVRELLAGAEDGVDRSTLELLAGERHLSSEDLTAALSAWQAAGKVRIDDDGEGREVVRWVAAPPSPGAPADPAPPSDPAESA